jgi:hypothetical protein
MTYRIQEVNHQTVRAVDSDIWGVTLFDADDSAPDYIGVHLDKDAATSDPNWKVRKFTYSGANVTKIELAYGAWDDRVSLF